MCAQPTIQNQKPLNHSMSENMHKQMHEWTNFHLKKITHDSGMIG